MISFLCIFVKNVNVMAYLKSSFKNSASSTRNIKKINAAKFPDGHIYIIKHKRQDLYKIGVSNNPKRRIADISAILPFDITVIFVSGKLENVYELETIIHARFKLNKVKKEWFNSYKEDIDNLIEILK